MIYVQFEKKFKLALCGMMFLAGCCYIEPEEQYNMQAIVDEVICEDEKCKLQLKSIENGLLILYGNENQVIDFSEDDYVNVKYKLDNAGNPVLLEISMLECEIQIMEINGTHNSKVYFSSAQINKGIGAAIPRNFMRNFSEGDIVKVYYVEEASGSGNQAVIYMEKSGGLYEQEFKASEAIGFIPTKIVIEEEDFVGLDKITIDDEKAIKKLMEGLEKVLVYKDYAIQHWFGTAFYTMYFYNGDERIQIVFNETLTITYPDKNQIKYGYRTSNLTFETCNSITTKWLTGLGVLQE